MRTVFADSFYYFALMSPKDPAHNVAAEFAAKFTGRIVTTQWVLTEVADGMARTAQLRQLASNLIRELRAQPSTRVIRFSQDHFEAGVDLYSRRPDKTWSLTDCVSFVVMGQEGITEALTGDHHFEQAGFVALLK